MNKNYHRDVFGLRLSASAALWIHRASGNCSTKIFSPRYLLVTLMTLALCACGHAGSAGAPTYTITGTLSGLSASSSVTLEDIDPPNAEETFSTNGSITIANALVTGTSYSIQVATQPTGETCTVNNGSGIVGTSNVINITVSCLPTSLAWTWAGGSNIANATGVYGTQGVAAAANIPGARQGAVSWTDSSNNLWMFGGAGNDFAGTNGYLNDLWKYSTTSGQWTWVNGSDSTAFQASTTCGATFGTKGTPASTNEPNRLRWSSSWTDPQGNFWLFGGFSGCTLYVNDLWEYSPTSGQWIWQNGAEATAVTGVYGTQGTPAASNAPGGRGMATTWTDTSGNLWLFGGYGYSTSSTPNALNDLWKYSAGKWTWVSGSQNAEAPGVYGTLGTAAAANTPGARYGAASWVDTSGNLWLFGGQTGNLVNQLYPDNDLWMFSPTTGEWTWEGGAATTNANSVFGTQGTAAAGNVPGSRSNSTAWTDALGNFWLFGGFGQNASLNGPDYLTELWTYSPTTKQWTWVKGSSKDTAVSAGVYGVLGTAATTNNPGGRFLSPSWVDTSGNLWLFGGYGYDSVDSQNILNDLWKYATGVTAAAPPPPPPPK